MRDSGVCVHAVACTMEQPGHKTHYTDIHLFSLAPPEVLMKRCHASVFDLCEFSVNVRTGRAPTPRISIGPFCHSGPRKLRLSQIGIHHEKYALRVLVIILHGDGPVS